MPFFILTSFRSYYFVSHLLLFFFISPHYLGALRAKVEEIREMKSLQTRRAELFNSSLKNEMTKIDYLLNEQSNLEKLIDRYKYGM